MAKKKSSVDENACVSCAVAVSRYAQKMQLRLKMECMQQLTMNYVSDAENVWLNVRHPSLKVNVQKGIIKSVSRNGMIISRYLQSFISF